MPPSNRKMEVEEMNRKISAASAKTHTRSSEHSNYVSNLRLGILAWACQAIQPGIFNILLLVGFAGILAWAYQAIQPGIFNILLLVGFAGILAWAYQAIQPPPPTICGSPHGPPVTAPRLMLRDGRHLAYKEHGVPINAAKFKIIYIHPFDSSRNDAVVTYRLSPELVQELGVYVVSFDRPGYGESDPHPQRTLKSLALDIEELANRLRLGPKFYVIGYSMGGTLTWGCLKYIPHRLAGAVLLAPGTNYWWHGLPSNLSSKTYNQRPLSDQWALRVAHYAPWLTYWWNTQKFFPGFSVVSSLNDLFSIQDKEVVAKLVTQATAEDYQLQAAVRQQGESESIYRDLNVGYGSWEFSPMDMENPFPNNEGSVHLWQGDKDRGVPVMLQRYVAQRLSWIHYHELTGSGHLFPLADGMFDIIVKTLLTGEK